jgi:hypothetical protein
MHGCFPESIQMVLRLRRKAFRLQPRAFKAEQANQGRLAGIGILAGALAGFLG